MNMETNGDFKEDSASRKDSALSNAVYVVSYIFVFVFGLLGAIGFGQLIQWNFKIIYIVMFVVFGGGAVGLWFLKDLARVEYDYTFTAGSLDVARITNRKHRKKLLTVSMDNVDYVAPIGYKDFEKELKSPNLHKKYNCFVNPGPRLYYMIITRGGTKSILVFEPSRELLKLFAKYKPRDILVKDEPAPAGTRFS